MGRLLRGGLACACLGAVAAVASAQERAPAPKDDTLPEVYAPAWRRAAPYWPFLEHDRFDRDVLGPDPLDPDLVRWKDVDVLWPFFGYRNEVRDARGGTVERGHAYLLPLFWSAWDEEGSDTLVGPVAGLFRRGDLWRAWLFPALATAGGSPEGWDVGLAWPLLAAGTDRTGWWARAAPLAWFGGGEDRARAAVLPAFWYERFPTGHTLFVSPLVARVEGADWAYTAITPLYHRFRDARRQRAVDVVLPFGFRTADQSSSLLVTPVVIHARGPLSRYTMATPFVHTWRALDAKGEAFAGGDVVGPFFVRVFDRETSVVAALPFGIFWRGRDAAALDVLGPAWRYTAAHDRRSGFGLFPLLWSWRDAERGLSSFTLLPLYHEHTETGAGTRSRIALPLFIDWESPARRFVGTPLGWWHADRRTGGSSLAILPFYYRRAESARGPWLTVIPPLYVGWADATGRRFDVDLGLLWRWRDPARDRHLTLAIPVAFDWQDGPSRTTVLPFWFAHDDPERSIRCLFPVWAQATRGDRTRTHVLFPLLSWETSPRGVESVDALWPLVAWGAEDGRRHLRALPLAWSTRDVATGDGLDCVGPFWAAWQGPAGTYRHLLPLFASWRGASGSWWTSVGGPLVVVHGQDAPPAATAPATPSNPSAPSPPAPSLAVEVLWPLAHWGREGDRTAWWVLPLAGGATTPTTTRFFAMPGIYHQSDPDGSDTVLGPLLWDRRRADSHQQLAPLWWSRDAPGVRERVLFPLFWDLAHPGSTSFHVWPLFGRDTWQDPGGGLAHERLSVAFPFFRYWHEPPREAWGIDAPWPLVAYQSSPDTTHARIAPFLWYWRWGEERVAALLPLWAVATRPDGFTALAPLTWIQSDPRTTRVVLFPLFWWFDEPGWQLRALWPVLGWSRRLDAAGATTRVEVGIAWPFLRYMRDSAADRTEAYAPWPLVGYQSDPSGTSAWAFPAAYVRSTPTHTGVDLLPLTLLPVGRWLHADHDAYVGLGWPLGFAYSRRGDRVHAHVLGLLWHDGSPDGALTIAPFVHYRRSGEAASWSVLFPLLWGASGPGNRWGFRCLWEGFVIRSTPEEYEWRVCGKLVRYWTRGDEGSFELNPLFRCEWKGDEYWSWSILLGFYRYQRIRQTVTHRIGWVIEF